MKRGPKPKFATLAERVLARITLADENDPCSCWLYGGNVDAKGYGCITVRVRGKRNPTRVRTHKVLWEWANGRKLRSGLTLDHRPTCPKRCGNPEHLSPCTRATNTARMNWHRYYRDKVAERLAA